MKKLFLVLGLCSGIFFVNSVNAACGDNPPANVCITLNQECSPGVFGVLVTWDGATGERYDILVERDNFPQNTFSILNINNNSKCIPYRDLYNGQYCFKVRTHCPDGSVSAWSICTTGGYCPTSVLIQHPDCKVDIPACVGVSLGGKISDMGGFKEIELDCNVEYFTLVPEIPVKSGVITGYTVSSIPYNPQFPFVIPPGPDVHNINLEKDDYFAEVAPLPFNFCFYENSYNQVLIGPNGNISFNIEYEDEHCTWIPPVGGFPSASPAELRNSVFGVFGDTEPSVGNTIGGATYQWAVLGEVPCRAFVVSYNDVPLYRCNEIQYPDHYPPGSSPRNSYQTILYENSNIIDVYVKKLHVCNFWNYRNVIGVQNSTGTKATCAPGRNSNDPVWTATDEAWRFTPVTDGSQSVKWYNGVGANSTPFSTAATTTFNCEVGSATVTIQYDFISCTMANRVFYDTVKVYWKDKVDHTFRDTICQTDPYSWRNGVINTQGYGLVKQTYKQNIFGNCCDTTFFLELLIEPQGSDLLYDTICYGNYFYYGADKDGDGIGDKVATNPKDGGFYTDTIVTSNGCLYLPQTKLKILPVPNATQSPLPEEICADDPSFFINFMPIADAGIIVPSHYKVEFDAKATAAGFADIEGDFAAGTMEIEVPINGVAPDTYTCKIILTDSLYNCKGKEYMLEFDVLYPTSVMEQKFDDVIAVRNRHYNGGYDFTAFQWYKNGEAIAGATGSNLYLNGEKLETTDGYYVLLTRTDGVVMRTCTFNPHAPKPTVSTFPTVVVSNNQIKIVLTKNNAVANLWTTTGILMQTVKLRAPAVQEIPLPSQRGTYFFEVVTDDGQREVTPVITIN
jgi:hypothetical protein